MNKEINVYIRGVREDEYWIDFKTGEEKLAFMQKYLPELYRDLAIFGEALVSTSQPILFVKIEWLKSQKDLIIHGGQTCPEKI